MLLPGIMPTTCAKVYTRNPWPRGGMALPHSLKNECSSCRPGKRRTWPFDQRGAPTMIHTHSVQGPLDTLQEGQRWPGRRLRLFGELRDRVAKYCGYAQRHGTAGDRLALLPNECEYISWSMRVPGWAWSRYTQRGLRRWNSITCLTMTPKTADWSTSSLPVPTVQPPWQRTIRRRTIGRFNKFLWRPHLRHESDPRSPHLHKQHNRPPQECRG